MSRSTPKGHVIHILHIVFDLVITAFFLIALYQWMGRASPDGYRQTAEVLLDTYEWESIKDEDIFDLTTDAEGSRGVWNSVYVSCVEKNQRYNLYGATFDVSELYPNPEDFSDPRVNEPYLDMVVNLYVFQIRNPYNEIPLKAEFAFYDGVLGIARVTLSENADMGGLEYAEDMPPTSWPLDVSKEEFRSDILLWEEWLPKG